MNAEKALDLSKKASSVHLPFILEQIYAVVEDRARHGHFTAHIESILQRFSEKVKADAVGALIDNGYKIEMHNEYHTVIGWFGARRS